MRATYAVAELGVWGAWTMTVRILGDFDEWSALGYPNPGHRDRGCGRRREPGPVAGAPCPTDVAVMFACAAFIVHAYFVLGVQVHENHLYLAVPLLAGAAACRPRLRPVLLWT